MKLKINKYHVKQQQSICKKLLLLLIVIASLTKQSQAQIITTVAGSSFVGSGVATVVGLSDPSNVAIDAAGNLYIAETGHNCIRKVNTSGMMTTFAGNGTAGHSGDGGQATAASLHNPEAITIDAIGNLYITEVNSVRKVNSLGIITTIAGNDTSGFRGDGGQATAAELSSVQGITIDAAGNLYVVDNGNKRIRMINTSGIISTVVGNGTTGFSGDGGQATAAELYNPMGITMDAAGNLYIADEDNNRIRMVNTSGIISTVAGNGTYGFTGDGGQATAAELKNPTGIVIDAVGNIYVADAANDRIRIISTTGIITTFAGNGTFGYSGDGGAATAAQLNSNETFFNNLAVGIDNLGNLYIADIYNNAVRKVNTMGIISTVAGGGVGDGEQATNAQLAHPVGVTDDVSGNIYIADASNNRIRKINTSGIISTVAGSGTYGFTGDGGQATAAELADPFCVAIDALGNLFIADESNNRIRMVSTSGIITTFAGNGTAAYSGDGGQASAAALNEPLAVVFDAVGNLYISDTYNNRIRKVNSLGIITTIAGNGGQSYSGDGGQATAAALYNPKQITFDAVGNLYFADMYNNCIRKINSSGIINTVASGLNTPSGVAFDNMGNMYISDGGNQRIRRVNTAGIISTIVGNGIVGFTGDGGQSTSAELDDPSYIMLDAAGNLYIADNFNNRIRKVTLLLTITANSATICAGGTTTLTTSGATSYTWSPATGLSNTTGSAVAANPTVTTIYTVTGAMGAAMGLATLTVTVNPSPSAPVLINNNPLVECQGQTATTLSLTPVSAVAVWYNGTNAGSPVVNLGNTYTPSTSVVGTTVYSIKDSITTAGGCTSSPITVTVNINPTPTISVNQNIVICPGATSTLCASGASTYTWVPYLLNGYVGTCMSINTPGNYTLTGTDANGCTSTTSTNVQAVGNPTVSISAPSSSCLSQCVTYTAYTSPVISSFYWDFGNGQTSSSASPTCCYSVPGNMSTTLTVIDVNNCTNTATTSITVNPIPSVSYTLTQDAAPQTWDAYPTYPANIISYSWDWGDGTPPSTTAYPSHVYSIAGTYSICVTVTDANGCSATTCQNDAVYRLGSNSTLSNMIYVNVLSGQTTSLNQLAVNSNQVTVYPNPNNGTFAITTTENAKIILVTDILGNELLSVNPSATTTNINLSAQPNGIYFVKVMGSNTQTVKRIIINN